MNALELNNVTCRFNGVTALDGASLSVAPDEFVSLSGGNGAGKTTMLNVASGGANPVAGTVRLYGKDIARKGISARARLGVIRSLENNGIYPGLNVVDNVVAGLFEGSLRTLRNRARRWLDIVDVPTARYGGELSIGQQRRVEIARILARVDEHRKQCVVLLDEPFRGLDQQSRESVAELLIENLRGRVPVVMVEHDTEMTERLSTRNVSLENGRVMPHQAYVPDHSPRREPVLVDPNADVVLRINGLRAGFERAEVLHGINLSVREGECVRIRGGNGAGKTTMLRVMLGNLRPMVGCVEWFGQKLAGPTDAPKCGIGYAPQGAQLVPGLTVSEHIEMSRKVASARGASPELGPQFEASFPELREVKRKLASDLSSGQRALVSIATAMMTEPRVLLADEPAAGMSSSLARRLADFLSDRWIAPNRTTVLVEHGRFDFPSRTIALERGQLVC